MQATRLKIFAVLVVCSVLFSPLFGQSTVSSQGSSTSNGTAPFIKLVNTGFLIQTIQDAQGGFVSINSSGPRILFLRRVMPSGEPTWERVLAFESEADFISLNAIAQTADGGYIVVGEEVHCNSDCYGFNVDYNAIAAKLDSNGAIQWKKRFSVNSRSLRFNSVVSSADRGFVAGGSQGGYTVVARFNSTGDILWSKGYKDLSGGDFKLLGTPDNEFFLVTTAYQKIGGGTGVIKLNRSGNVVWGKSFYNDSFNRFFVPTVKVTPDRGIVFAGVCQKCGQFALIRLDLNGQISWKIRWKANYAFQKVYGPWISDFTQTPDGGYAVEGYVVTREGEVVNPFLSKIGPSHRVVFQERYEKKDVGGGFVFTTGRSEYLIFRPSGLDTLIFKFNSQGTVPACSSSFRSVATESISFGEVTTEGLNVRQPVNLSLRTTEIATSSGASIHTVTTTVCE